MTPDTKNRCLWRLMLDQQVDLHINWFPWEEINEKNYFKTLHRECNRNFKTILSASIIVCKNALSEPYEQYIQKVFSKMVLLPENIAIYLLSISVVLILLAYHYLTSTFSFWESKNIPYIKPEIFFGTMKDIITFKISQPEKFQEFHRYFRERGHSYGGIFELRKPVLLLCTPDIVKDVMVKNFPTFHDRGLAYDEHFDPLTAHLILLDGQRWKYLRSKLAPAFSTGKLKEMVYSMAEAAQPLLNLWNEYCENDQMIDVRELMAQYTTDVIGLCAFGLQLNSVGKDSDFRRMGRKIFEPNKTEKLLQIVRNVYPWIYKTFKLKQYSDEMTKYFMGVLGEAMEYRTQNKIEKNDFLNYLMKIRDAKGAKLKDLEEMKGVENYSLSVQEDAIELSEGIIAAQAFIFFLAGFETTSTCLSFCLYELAQNPQIQEKLQTEIVNKLNVYKEINYDLLQDLPYMEQVLKECLRKHPPVPLLLRESIQPYKLPDSNVVLPKGTQIFISPYSMHKDPEYFPEPEIFDPERFSPENREKIIPFSYLPFGDGPRVCIGLRFAMLEMKTVLTSLLAKFTVVNCEKTKPVRIHPDSFVLTAMDGIWIKTKRRTITSN